MKWFNFLQVGSRKALPCLCASSGHLSGNGVRSCTEQQGAVLPGQGQGRHSWRPGVCVHVWGKAKGTHSWGTSNRREIHQWEEQSLWGVRQCKDTRQFPQKMLYFSEISPDTMFSHFWKDTTLFYSKTISGNTVRGVILHLASTTVYLRVKKILTNENMHHSDNVIPLYEGKKRYQKVLHWVWFQIFFYFTLKCMLDLVF